jgi:hypothetical protein
MKRGGYLGDQGADNRKILKIILRELDVRVWNVIWLRIRKVTNSCEHNYKAT